MKKIIIFLWLLFTITNFLKPGFYEFDSYFYLNISCGKLLINNIQINEQIWAFLPCNEYFFKALQSIFLGIVLFFLIKTGEAIEPKYKYWLPLIASFYLYFFTNFFRLENDLLGLVFIFGSLYFLVAAFQKEFKPKEYIISGLFAIIGILFWKGTAIWLIMVLLCHPKLKYLGIGLIIWFSQIFFILNTKISDEQPFLGVAFNILIWIGFLFIPKWLFLPAVFGFLLAFFQLKFALFFAIPLLIGLYQILCKRRFFEDEPPLQIILPFFSKTITKQQLFLLIILLFSSIEIVSQINSPPDPNLQKFVKDVTVLAGDKSITNEFMVGDMITYYGGHPTHRGGFPNPDFNSAKGYVLTLQKLNCREISRLKNVQDVNFIFYHC